jgi:hypothetical protein
MEDQPAVRRLRVLVQMIDTLGIEQRTAPLDAVDFVSLVEQVFAQVRTVLAGDAGNQCPAPAIGAAWRRCIAGLVGRVEEVIQFVYAHDSHILVSNTRTVGGVLNLLSATPHSGGTRA